jgi:hypothetical protein
MSSLRVGVGQGTIAALFTASLLLGNACSGDGGEVEFDPVGGSNGNGAASMGGSKPSTGGTSTLAGASAGGASNVAGTNDGGGTDAGTASGGSNSAGSEAGGTDSGGTDSGGTDSGGSNSAGTDSGGMAGGGMAGMSGNDTGGMAGGGMAGAGSGGGGTTSGGAGGMAGAAGVGGMAGAAGAGGMAGAGGAPACTPTLEVCDGVDNDCDKIADQGNTCAAGCTGASYDGHSYAFCGTVESAPAAVTKCQSMGLGMVMIQSPGENVFVTSKIKGSSWIGASDQAQEKNWVWYATGEVFWSSGPVDGKYQNWQEGQPNDSGPMGADENCAVMIGSVADKGKWNDLGCNFAGYRAACETLDPIP